MHVVLPVIATVSGGHTAGIGAGVVVVVAGGGVGVVGAVVVVGVAVHSLAPAEDQEPAEQSVQVLTFVAPVWLEYLPATHGTQPIWSFSGSYTAI